MDDLEKIAAAFHALETPRQLAQLLGVDYGKHLTYHLYRRSIDRRYQAFEIRKKSGGVRKIRAPDTRLKLIQQSLLHVLSAVYDAKPSVHGFVLGRSILTNAKAHRSPKIILNVDLKDFFPTINFGRVRGMFMAVPYKLPPEVATVIAQICCHENELPQGAPTSPIISNMICAKMDSQLQRLAKELDCFYTRYADDMTFSTRRSFFPRELSSREYDGDKKIAIVGPRLKKVISENGFEINQEKVRLHTKSDRQEVTGLVVNEFTNVRRTYVRQIRSMLFSWRVDGLEAAQKKFYEKHDLGNRFPLKEPPSLPVVVRGKLEFLRSVRGDANPTYRQLCAKFNNLSPDKPILLPEDPIIEKLKRAVVVIEHDGIGQGTAFFLKGVGLITCAHCVGRNPYIYFPDAPVERIPVEVIKTEQTVDVAILRTRKELTEFEELERQGHAIESTGSEVALAGYPAHGPGKSLSWKQGIVSGFQMKSTIRRYLVSFGIVSGASGSPLLTLDGKVVGIAVTGADFEHEQDQTTNHGAIPVSAIDLLE